MIIDRNYGKIFLPSMPLKLELTTSFKRNPAPVTPALISLVISAINI